uniref:Uncharacterized protein n=1 Tax=Tetranychus urticae TaxID=32264 RepID=T1JZ18_TETUR
MITRSMFPNDVSKYTYPMTFLWFALSNEINH